MKNNKFSLVIGVLALTLTVGLNVRHAINGYGIVDTTLKVEALVRTTDEGTLYGNEAGTLFCCCPGNRSCGAAPCKGCPVD